MDHAHGVRLGRALAVVTALAAFAPHARGACSGFGVGGQYLAGSSPQAVVGGDFDRDGVPDLAIANLSGAALTVLRGTGGGGFAAAVPYAGGTSGRAIATSDFNGDGIPDLAVGVNEGVAIWLGVGYGAFTGGAIVSAGSALRGIVCEDFDRDGIVDLAVTSSATNAVLVLRGIGSNGIGNGTFAAPVSCPVGANPARVLAADVDGDGITDLVVANNSGASVSILRGNGAGGVGDGTFAPANTIAVAGSPWSAVALDWNHDGLADLVVSNGAGTSVALLRGTGGGAFLAAGTVTTPTAPRDLVAGDFDGDGTTDVAAACAATNNVVVLHGTGAGFTTLGTFATGSGAGGLAAGDWNGDGAPDLACVNSGSGSVTRLAGTCPAAASAHVTLLAPLGHETWWPGTLQQARWTRGAGVTSVNVEISRDGGLTWLPLARGLTSDQITIPAVGVPGPHVRVRVSDALVPARADASPADLTLCGVFGAPIVSPAGLAATQLASADLNGDGVPDVVACDATSAIVFAGDGAGHFTTLWTLAADSTRRVALADVTGDALTDLIRLTPAGVAVRAGDGHGHFGLESVRALAGGSGLVAADLDGDGIADLAVLAADGAAARLYVWRSATPGAPWSAAVAGAPGALTCADLDGDGIADLALGAGASVQTWYGTGAGGRGDGGFRLADTRSLPAAGGDLVLADTNGDGALDVIACLPATGDLVAVPSPAPAELLVSGSTSPAFTVPAGVRPCAPLSADLDGDGRPDLVLALSGENAIAVLPGTPGGFATPVRFPLGTSAAAMVVDDFTGDGEPDAVVAGADGQLYCLPAQCPPKLPASLAFAPATFADTSAVLAGFTRALTWQRSTSVAAVRLELSRDGGAHWTTLADGVTASSFRWAASGPACVAARVRVRDAACGTRFDVSATFPIRDAFVAGPASATASGGTQLVTGDVDGDGILDAVVSRADGVEDLRGDGAGGFHLLWQGAWAGVEAGRLRARLADVDGDGVLDLATLQAASVGVRPGDGHGAFGEPQSFTVESGAVDFAIADVDEDGRPDLITAAGDGGANRVSVRRGVPAESAGAVAFGAPWFALLPAAPTAMAVADMNGDGVLDLVVAHATGFATLLGNGGGGHGAGTFHLTGNRAFGGALRELRLADLDGDGRVDLAALDATHGNVVVAAGDGAGGLGTPVSIAAGGTPVGLALADLDRDGTLDLVATIADGTLSLMRGIPNAALASRFAPAARFAGVGAAVGGALVDVDADGVADAIALDPAGELRVQRGRSSAVSAPRLAVLPAQGAVAGSELPLHWSTPPGVIAVNIELSRDGGVNWSRIADGVGGGAWTWSVTGPATANARLRVRDANVPVACDSASAVFAIAPVVTGVAPTATATLRLGAPWPNPMRADTQIELAVPANSSVRVEVCDVAGRHARTLAAGVYAAGAHTLHWSGEDDRGRPLPAGMYFVRARLQGAEAMRRVVLTR